MPPPSFPVFRHSVVTLGHEDGATMCRKPSSDDPGARVTVGGSRLGTNEN